MCPVQDNWLFQRMWPAGQEAVEEELIDVDMLEQECEAGESIEDNM